jgi:hypothetical protein
MSVALPRATASVQEKQQRQAPFTSFLAMKVEPKVMQARNALLSRWVEAHLWVQAGQMVCKR